MSKKIYAWEITDTLSGKVVSSGMGKEHGKKTLSYLRYMYGSHLDLREKKANPPPSRDIEEIFFEEENPTKAEIEKYPSLFQDTDLDLIPDVDDPEPFTPSLERIEEVSLSDEMAELLKTRRQFGLRLKPFEKQLKDFVPRGVKVKVRVKTLYSIINKLRRKRIFGPKGITDIAGALIVTKDKKQLDAINKKVKKQFATRITKETDYYKKPLAGYRAIHYLLDQNKKYPIELQLKTQRMKRVSKAAHSGYKKGIFDADEMEKLGRLADRADRGNSSAQRKFDAITNEDMLIRISGRANPSEVGVKNPSVLADSLDVLYYPPLARHLTPKEHEYLKKVQKRLRKGKKLKKEHLEFIGDAMHIIMKYGDVQYEIETHEGTPGEAMMLMNPEQRRTSTGRGRIGRKGRIGNRGNFPVWFVGEEGERPVMFDRAFADRDEMRPGRSIGFEYLTTGGGWRIVRSDFNVTAISPEDMPQSQRIEITAEFTTGYVTKPRGADEGETPYRMAWAPRQQQLSGTIEGISGLKLPEDVTDAFNENRLRNDLPKIMPSYGRVMVKGIKNGRVFEVSQIFDFRPEAVARDVSIPLSELHYDLNFVSFNYNNLRGVVNINLPFDSHPTLNSIKQHFEGNVRINGEFKKEGWWDSEGEHHYQYYLGNTAEWSETSIDNLKRIIRSHRETQQIQDLIERFYRSGQTVSMLTVRDELQRILGRAVTVTETENVLVTRRVEYEWEYIEMMKSLSEEMNGEYMYIPHLRKPEFVFVINKKVILEIPVTNKASYIFNLDEAKGLEQQLADIRAVPQRSMIYRDDDIKAELKYITRTIHRTPEGWIDRVKTIVEEEVRANPTEEELREKYPDADIVLARSLVLWATNDKPTYRQLITPMAENFARKKIRQEFVYDKAINGIVNIFNHVKKQYWHEIHPGQTPPRTNRATKLAFAEDFLDEMDELIRDIVEEYLMGLRTRRMGARENVGPKAEVVQIEYVPPSMGGV